MKILEINKFYFPKRGAERHFLDLIALLESRGHEVAVFSMAHNSNISSKWQRFFVSSVGYTGEYSIFEKIRGVLRMFYSLEAKRKINKILDEFRPDVVHIHNIYHQLSPAILFEIKKRKIPVVMTVHDFKIVCPNHSLYLNGLPYERCRDGKFYQCFFDKCVKDSYAKSFLAMMEAYWHEWLGTYTKNIDAYIVPSEFVKNILIDRGIDKDKISMLPHFISKESEVAEEEAGNVSGYALYVGAISKDKGIENLLEMFNDENGAKLYLAGNMEDEIDIKKFKNAKYLGFLNKSQLSAAMEKASCVISGSRLPETFGLIALEALSLGKPFFGFDTGAFGEIVRNGENGFLAKDEKSLRMAMEKFFNGELSFDNEKIKNEALKRYEKNFYAAKLEEVFKSNAAIDKKSVF